MADDKQKRSADLPAWMATFADFMTLSLCFFVLIAPISVQDAKKYKAVVESLSNAFGMGSKEMAELSSRQSSEAMPSARLDSVIETAAEKESKEGRALLALLQEVQTRRDSIRELLHHEIEQGAVSVDTEGSKIIMRIMEKTSFTSGSAELKPGFETVMDKITEAAIQTKGSIRVAGHTDDVPITTSAYRSNWELSSARAVTVAQYMLKNKALAANRLAVEGYADTRPLVSNGSADNRSKNRRVEIIAVQEDAVNVLTSIPLADQPIH
jgi:chemotaxis protein MotB